MLVCTAVKLFNTAERFVIALFSGYDDDDDDNNILLLLLLLLLSQ
jgi:hypothetical protein